MLTPPPSHPPFHPTLTVPTLASIARAGSRTPVFPFEAGVLRLHLYGTEETACRWVDDGPNYELLYFSDPSPDGYFTSLFFMGTAFPRII